MLPLASDLFYGQILLNCMASVATEFHLDLITLFGGSACQHAGEVRRNVGEIFIHLLLLGHAVSFIYHCKRNSNGCVACEKMRNHRTPASSVSGLSPSLISEDRSGPRQSPTKRFASNDIVDPLWRCHHDDSTLTTRVTFFLFPLSKPFG